MIRSALLLPVTLMTWPLTAHAQAPAASTPSSPTSVTAPSQLDRIETKLDEVLHRLELARSQPSRAATSPAASANGLPPSSAPDTAPTTSVAAYKPGAIAIVHAAPPDRNALSNIPTDSVGGFVYEGGAIAFSDIRSRGVRYAGSVGVELQGWLKAQEAGRYQIGTDLTAHFNIGAVIAPTCFLQAWLEGHSLDQQSVLVSSPGKQDATASLVLGAELQPGIYRLRVWTTCTAPPGVTATSELLAKTPSQLNLRPVTGDDLLHREG